MDSVPPARTQEAVPVMMVWAARIMDLVPDAQTLLTVVQTVESGRPALMAHWRAGFWPRLWEECQTTGGMTMVDGRNLLSGEDIAVEDLLDIFGFQGRYPLEGSCGLRMVSLLQLCRGGERRARTFDGMGSQLDSGLACQCPSKDQYSIVECAWRSNAPLELADGCPNGGNNVD